MTFANFKNARIVRSGWLDEGGRRLDCNPYMSGAQEARDALKKLSANKDRLGDVTDAIYHAGREGRLWVDDKSFGVPFFGSSSILSADLSNLPLISKRLIERNPLFTLGKQWTLITRSGTIGRMTYVRPDMVGMACSEHVLRVVPNSSHIPPGYLYAFLSSKYGVPLVVSGTYGAIIQHIEPEHIAGLPVPRFGSDTELKVHELIETSAQKRSDAQRKINDSLEELERDAGFFDRPKKQVTSFSTSSVLLSNLSDRFDAPYHCAPALEAERLLDESQYPAAMLADVVAAYFKPPIFKRLWVDSEEHGRLFVSGNDIYRYQPEERRYVSKRTPKFDEFILKRGWVAFQAAGQIYGLFGRPLYINGWLEEKFCADDVFRIVPHDEVDGAFLYLFLRSAVGEALIKRQASGNSIPRVWEPHISRLRVLWPKREVRERYAHSVISAHQAIESARLAELEAVSIVERKIEGGK